MSFRYVCYLLCSYSTIHQGRANGVSVRYELSCTTLRLYNVCSTVQFQRTDGPTAVKFNGYLVVYFTYSHSTAIFLKYFLFYFFGIYVYITLQKWQLNKNIKYQVITLGLHKPQMRHSTSYMTLWRP